jgi:peptidylprolyl isomerase
MMPNQGLTLRRMEVYTVKNIRAAVIAALLLELIVSLGCGVAGAKKAADGDTVQVNYTGKLSDGTVFDSSAGRAPLEFKIGSSTVIPGFEKAIVGMAVGEKKTITIAADDAYGPRMDGLVKEISRTQLPKDLTPQVGQQLQSTASNGSTLVVTITKVGDTTVTIDANHPLAGKDLTFEIELVKIL